MMKNTITAALTLLTAGAAYSATFVPITGIDVNMVSGNPVGNPLSNVIEGAGSGFDAAEPHNQTGGTWYTDAPGGFPSDYIAVHAGPEYIWLDLGTDTLIGSLSYWGYSAGNANGMREFNISFATDAEGGDAGMLGDEAYGTSITMNPAFAALQAVGPRQEFDFADVTARYVRVEATSTFFDQPGAGAGGDRLGIGEIAISPGVIPEPSSAALLALAGLGLIRRKR